MADELPTNWVFTTLGEAFQWGSGGTPKAGEPRYYGGELPWLNIGDLTDSIIYDSAKTITQAGLRESAARIVEPGNVLVAMYGSIGKLGIAGTKLTTNQAIAFTRKIPKGVEAKYLFWFLAHAKADLVQAGKGGTQQNISQTVLKAVRFPLAPSGEQRRIVAKIEELFSELDKGVESLKAARARLKTYRQSLLKAAFEGRLTEQWRRDNADKLETVDQLLQRIREEREARYERQLKEWEAAVAKWEKDGKPGKKPRMPTARKEIGLPADEEVAALPELPKDWFWGRLASVAQVTGGLTKNPKRQSLPIKRPFLRVANVYANHLVLDDVHEIGVEETEAANGTLEAGDLLIVEGNGSVDQIGRVAVWDGSIENCVHQNHLIRARLIDSIHPRFVLLFMLGEQGRDLIVRTASSTSGLHTLSISKVENFLIPLCSVREQDKVLEALDAKLSQIDQLEWTIEAGLKKSAALRKSILKRAFEGKLVPQDPDDEPASVLLERIRQEQTDTPKPKRRKRKIGAVA